MRILITSDYETAMKSGRIYPLLYHKIADELEKIDGAEVARLGYGDYTRFRQRIIKNNELKARQKGGRLGNGNPIKKRIELTNPDIIFHDCRDMCDLLEITPLMFPKKYGISNGEMRLLEEVDPDLVSAIKEVEANRLGQLALFFENTLYDLASSEDSLLRGRVHSVGKHVNRAERDLVLEKRVEEITKNDLDCLDIFRKRDAVYILNYLDIPVAGLLSLNDLEVTPDSELGLHVVKPDVASMGRDIQGVFSEKENLRKYLEGENAQKYVVQEYIPSAMGVSYFKVLTFGERVLGGLLVNIKHYSEDGTQLEAVKIPLRATGSMPFVDTEKGFYEHNSEKSLEELFSGDDLGLVYDVLHAHGIALDNLELPDKIQQYASEIGRYCESQGSKISSSDYIMTENGEILSIGDVNAKPSLAICYHLYGPDLSGKVDEFNYNQDALEFAVSLFTNILRDMETEKDFLKQIPYIIDGDTQ